MSDFVVVVFSLVFYFVLFCFSSDICRHLHTSHKFHHRSFNSMIAYTFKHMKYIHSSFLCVSPLYTAIGNVSDSIASFFKPIDDTYIQQKRFRRTTTKISLFRSKRSKAKSANISNMIQINCVNWRLAERRKKNINVPSFIRAL